MELTKYIIVTPSNRKWGTPGVKLVNTTKSSVPANSVILKLHLDLPDELFVKPQLEAFIKVDKNKVSQPVIQAEVLDNIVETFKKKLGVDINVNMVDVADIRICRSCGCTDDDCTECVERTGQPCHWVEDDLCSACTPEELELHPIKN